MWGILQKWNCTASLSKERKPTKGSLCSVEVTQRQTNGSSCDTGHEVCRKRRSDYNSVNSRPLVLMIFETRLRRVDRPKRSPHSFPFVVLLFIKKNKKVSFFFFFLQMHCPIGIYPKGNSGCFPLGKPAATVHGGCFSVSRIQ